MSKRKRRVFQLATLAATVAVVEGLAAVGLSLVYPSRAALTHRQERLAQVARADTKDSPFAIHPFLGWCVDPNISDGESVYGINVPVNRLGFVEHQELIQKRAPKRLIVGVTGGSVSWQLAVGAEDEIRRVLQESPAFRDFNIRILRIGMSGFKQPQQLMAVNWLQAMGAEFDAVVNLDGFNELAVAYVENVAVGIHLTYPRGWTARTLSVLDPRTSAESMELLQILAGRQRAARRIRSRPFRYSSTANVIWALRDQYLRERKRQLEELVFDSRRQTGGQPFLRSGPLQEWSGVDESLDAASDLWAQCSIQLHHLLAGSDTVYLHVLQPNLHDVGSKRLSDEEQFQLRFASPSMVMATEKGYPRLRQRSTRLQEAGVHFVDLSKFFVDDEQTVYSDACCHLVEDSNRRLASAIAVELRGLLESRQDAASD